MKKVAVNLGRGFLVASIVWMLHNYYSSWHYHRLPNGILVVHAHPFSSGETSKTPFPVDNHKHKDSQMLMLDHNHLVFIFVSLFIAFGFHFLMKKQAHFFPPSIYRTAFCGKYFHLRAPPVTF